MQPSPSPECCSAWATYSVVFTFEQLGFVCIYIQCCNSACDMLQYSVWLYVLLLVLVTVLNTIPTATVWCHLGKWCIGQWSIYLGWTGQIVEQSRSSEKQIECRCFRPRRSSSVTAFVQSYLCRSNEPYQITTWGDTLHALVICSDE